MVTDIENRGRKSLTFNKWWRSLQNNTVQIKPWDLWPHSNLCQPKESIETMLTGKYWSMDNAKKKKRGNSYWKNREISGWKVHINTRKLNDHRCFSQLKDNKCIWTHGK